MISGRDANAIATTFVVSGMEPVRLVVHRDDGSWDFLCGTTVEAPFLLTVHASHMFDEFPELAELASLPCGYQAWRDERGDAWTTEPYDEEPSGPRG
jgi:hypothetical protein